MSKMRKSEPQHFFSTPYFLPNPILCLILITPACLQLASKDQWREFLIILPGIQDSWCPWGNSRFHHVCPDTAWLGCRGRSRLGSRRLTLVTTRRVTLQVESGKSTCQLGCTWCCSLGLGHTRRLKSRMLTLLVSTHIHPLPRFPLGLLLQRPCCIGEHLLFPLGSTESDCVTKSVAEFALSAEQLGTDNLGTLVP